MKCKIKTSFYMGRILYNAGNEIDLDKEHTKRFADYVEPIKTVEKPVKDKMIRKSKVKKERKSKNV